MAPANFEIYLPSFTGSADRLVPNLKDYNKCLDKGTTGNLSGTTISETLHVSLPSTSRILKLMTVPGHRLTEIVQTIDPSQDTTPLPRFGRDYSIRS
jgi:hypothetical protein